MNTHAQINWHEPETSSTPLQPLVQNCIRTLSKTIGVLLMRWARPDTTQKQPPNRLKHNCEQVFGKSDQLMNGCSQANLEPPARKTAMMTLMIGASPQQNSAQVYGKFLQSVPSAMRGHMYRSCNGAGGFLPTTICVPPPSRLRRPQVLL